MLRNNKERTLYFSNFFRTRHRQQKHQKTHFRLPMTTPDFHNLIQTLRSRFNLANPRFNTLIVSQFLDFCHFLRINFFILTAIFENANE